MKRLIRSLITLAFVAVIWLLPTPADLTIEAWHLFAIFVGTIIGFILQPFPLGAVAMISIVLVSLTQTIPLKMALSGFSNTTIWLIVCAFLFAKGFIKTGLGRRIAYTLIYYFGSSSLKLAYVLSISDFIISPATPSNTARGGGILFPIVKSLAFAFNSKPGATTRKIGAFLMVATFQVDAPIAAMFLTACAPNLLMATLAEQVANLNLSWGTWAIVGIIPGILSIIVIPFVIYKMYPPEIKKTPAAQKIAKKELDIMGKMSREEKIISAIFIGALLLWSTSQYTAIDSTAVAILGVSMMLITNILTWDDVLSEKSAWDGMIWMGTIVGLADAMNKLGFIAWFAQSVIVHLDGISWMITLSILFFVYMYSHYFFASLSGHATAMYGVFLAVAVATQAPPYLAAFGLAVLSNLMAGLTHYSTGSAPIYFGTGFVEQKQWWKIGFVCSVINFIIWIGIGAVWWKIIGIW